ncbi:MAG TPA: amino acid adenylation domain-containing protein, partial [Thermoanaerobaculia bacterium]|nr:amino acid adenylation domain-containing protein [Thermoanaerobaculia bacterium]
VGVLKAGGAFVPLDPAWPDERLALLLARTGAAGVVASAALAGRMARSPGFVVRLGDGGEDLAACPAHRRPPGPALPDLLAYLMHTSGSTGEPKGVAVTHRGVVRLVRQDRYARLAPDTVFLQLAPLAFDASTLEIWGSLGNGGRLVLAEPASTSLAELGAAIARHGITTLWLTAGLFHQFVDGSLAALRPLAELLAGGDSLSPAHVQQALRGLPGTRLVNGYGPTENTTFTCCQQLRQPGAVGATAAIGRPIAETEVFLLDAALAPAPIGIAGEIWIGGAGLARGYWGRPDLTADRFRPDGASGQAGGRLYRTGDRARWLAAGRVEFLGRLDRQVKLRGFRVEPAEVEAALLRHPRVRDAAVVVRHDPAGDESRRQLVAYLAAAPPGEAPGWPAVRDFLRHSLPEPLVPAAAVWLPHLPLTVNGKVDRDALAVIDPGGAAAGDDGLAPPRDAIEELLAGIFAEVLGREQVGTHDDFFDLGGQSLLAVRLVSRVRALLGVELPLASLFAQPTVAALAPEIEMRRRGDGGTRLAPPPLAAGPRGEAGPLSFAQQRLWFLDRLAPGSPLYNIPLALLAHGTLDAAALARALDAVARRHDSLRTAFPTAADGRTVRAVVATGGVRLSAADLRALPPARREGELSGLVAAAARRPFDLARGPVARALLVRLDGRRQALLLVVHHIACDGWSLGVLLRELGALYGAFAAGRPSPRPAGSAGDGGFAGLPELPVQYVDFARWQRRWLTGDTLARELAWWRDHLAGAAFEIALPGDRPRPAAPTLRGGALPLALPPALRSALHACARRHGATLYMTLLAAWAALLARSTGQLDLLVGSPVANRGRHEIEGLIGFFVNTLALRCRLQPPERRESFAALLAAVRETTLAAYAHQDLPFDRLVEELAPQRQPGHMPLVQVLLALQNAPLGALELPGLRLEPLPVHTGTAKFDLTLELWEEPAGGLAGTLEYA